jgi:lysophospholipase L1-like esterase
VKSSLHRPTSQAPLVTGRESASWVVEKLPNRRAPGSRLKMHPRPPKITQGSASTLAGATFHGATIGGVVMAPSTSPFDFGICEGQMDTMYNVFSPTYANTYPYNATLTPADALGAAPSPLGNGRYHWCRFMTDAPSLELLVIVSTSLSDWQIYVDGQPIFPTFQPANGASTTTVIRLDFGSRKDRLVELEGGVFFTGVNTAPYDQVWKPAPQTGPRVGFLGDSVTLGSGATTALQGFAYTLTRLLGWELVNMNAQGGTGYVASGSFSNFPARVPQIVADTPDVVLVIGGHNDVASDPTTVVAPAVIATFQALRKSLPRAKLVYVGPWGSPRLGLGATYTAQYNAVVAAFAANPGLADAIVDTVQGGLWWFTGTGYQGATTGDGNSDYYIYSDGVHFTQAGHDYAARKLAAFIFRYLPNLVSVEAADTTDPAVPYIDTAANLAADNKVHNAGQLVIESDTLKWKIGDAATTYTSLTYGSRSMDVQIFTASGTWTKPANGKLTSIFGIAGGGGGGAGFGAAAGTARCGGGGGGAGGVIRMQIPTADLGATETVTVGAAGTGGVAGGAAATAGGATAFGTRAGALAGGAGGAGGNAVAGTAGGSGFGNHFTGNTGGASSATGGAAGNSASAYGPSGGGAGGGVTTANAASAGGLAGFALGTVNAFTSGGAATGAAGTAGTASTCHDAGSGGGGGGGNTSGTGGAGGAGGIYGAGGGGGGGGTSTGGAGGNGAQGLLIATTSF